MYNKVVVDPGQIHNSLTKQKKIRNWPHEAQHPFSTCTVTTQHGSTMCRNDLRNVAPMRTFKRRVSAHVPPWIKAIYFTYILNCKIANNRITSFWITVDVESSINGVWLCKAGTPRRAQTLANSTLWSCWWWRSNQGSLLVAWPEFAGATDRPEPRHKRSPNQSQGTHRIDWSHLLLRAKGWDCIQRAYRRVVAIDPLRFQVVRISFRSTDWNESSDEKQTNLWVTELREHRRLRSKHWNLQP